MKKFISILLTAILAISLTGCFSSNNDNNANDTTTNENTEQNILIAYYSLSGNTKAAAEEIQKQAGGDLVEITRTEAYPEDFYDLAENEIINHEQPAITLSIDNIDDYDVIFVGYPIWWHDVPMAVYTFLENYDFEGKTVIPFCTSGGSDIEESIPGIEAAVSGATMLEGLTANDSSDVQPWLEEIGILK